MILAAANGSVECVKELLDQGADPTARRVVSAKIWNVRTIMLIWSVEWWINVGCSDV